MAYIRKNKSGTYTATVYVGRDANDKMLREYVTRPTWHECRDAARELEAEIAARSLTNLAGLRMSDYMDRWIEVNRGILAPSTFQTYKIYIRVHFRPYFKRLRVRDITDMHIKQYISDKLETHSSTTVRKHFFTLSKMLRDALKHKSPCIGIKAPPMGSYKPIVPTEKEFEQIHNLFRAIGPEEEAVILLAGLCGLRRGEIFALKWDDVSWAEEKIRVDEAMAVQEESSIFALKDPKSVNSIRQVPIPEYLLELLRDLQKERFKKVEGLKDGELQTMHIIPLNIYTFTTLYRETIEATGLPRIRLHDLRHYHASLLYKHNVPDHYAAEQLGHDIWVLKKIYQHLGLEEKKELDDKVKSIFSVRTEKRTDL